MTKRRALIVMSSPTVTVLRSVKRARPCDHVHAEPGEALLGVDRRDRRDDAVDVVMDLGEVDGRRATGRSRTGRRGALLSARLAAAISAFDGTQP